MKYNLLYFCSSIILSFFCISAVQSTLLCISAVQSTLFFAFLQCKVLFFCISAVQRRVHSTAQSRSCIRNYIRANCQQRWQRFSSLCDSGWLVVVIQYGTGDRILSHLESLQVSQISSLAHSSLTAQHSLAPPQSSITAAALFQVTQSRGFKKNAKPSQLPFLPHELSLCWTFRTS